MQFGPASLAQQEHRTLERCPAPAQADSRCSRAASRSSISTARTVSVRCQRNQLPPPIREIANTVVAASRVA